MLLPAHLQKFIGESKSTVIKEIEFSGNTYQVLVEDPKTKEDFWVFLQLDPSNAIKDGFCSCEDGHHLEGCLHLAAAYCALFDENQFSLQLRFEQSLWNQLCQIAHEQFGDDPQKLVELQEGHYIAQNKAEKIIYSIKVLSQEAEHSLQSILFSRPAESEETSLKFSNLADEELNLWKEGRPSPQLCYDLSFWSDLARWLTKLQFSQEKYTIQFKFSKRQIPNWITVKFLTLEMGFNLSENELVKIIPSLNTVNSPLKILNAFDTGIDRMVFDQTTKQLRVFSKKIEKRKETAEDEKIQLGNWWFIPNQGFYQDEPHFLLQNPVIEKEELSYVLTEYRTVISQFLTNGTIHSQPIPLHYFLSFDSGWNLIIEAYMQEPGDLSQGANALFDDWIYIERNGFYPVVGKLFGDAQEVIPLAQVSDFVTHNRGWLSGIKGFSTHVASIQYQIGYQLSPHNRLTFHRVASETDLNSTTFDFGLWVYVKDLGFFVKSSGNFAHLLKSGFSLSEEQIPLFIRTNLQELSLIPHFFMPSSPVKDVGLQVDLIDRQVIEITPTFELIPPYDKSKFRVFDDVIYVENEGFYVMPSSQKLPLEYRQSLILEGEELDLFLSFRMGEIQKFIKSCDKRLIQPKHCDLVMTRIDKESEAGRGWYRLHLSYFTENGFIPLIDIHKAVVSKSKQRFAFFNEGAIDLHDSRFSWLKGLKKERINKKDQSIVMSTLEFLRLHAFNPMMSADDYLDESGKELLSELLQFKTPDEPNIGGLKSSLRPYQEVGVRWLWFLYTQTLSGLLCDDMGLGKTHQAMALIASVRNYIQLAAEGLPCQFLVVCPTSVIYHWEDKLTQFFPGIRVCTFYGASRSAERLQEPYDILLTSYGILRNERKLLSEIEFEVAIYDEIQVAKNHYSLVYNALVGINAKMKLGLTGTPIENQLRELKSLFDIVLPSYMPGDKEYQKLFIRPIEKGNDPNRKALLHRLVNPFILRRKKTDVLTDLPEKTEEIAHCQLMADQAKLYSEVLEKRRHHLVEEIQNQETAIPFLHIFALLSSLKQICDHPAVYLKDPDHYQQYTSGKWTLFIELLREARESDQKVVVFTQYLYMMDIFEKYLSGEGIGFAAIRGATANRQDQIKKFQTDPDCVVFVGSLQAAGLGIDLTAGSVVIHYDRWWNAARENQATDRAYRIGQTKGVQVFKLVTEGTFEEKIHKMIERKSQLMEDVIGVDDQAVLKKFTRDELLSLLEFSAPETKEDEEEQS